MDRYLVGAAVQYSYSLFVLLQGGDLQQEEKYGKWGHSPRGEGNTSSNAPPPEGGQMCFLIHSFAHATHLFILFYKYLSRIYSVPALLSILENPALNQWFLLELTF